MAELQSPTSEADPANALAVAFSQTAKTLFAAGTTEETLAKVTSLALTTIEGCDLAGIFIVDGETVKTVAHSDPVVAAVDDLQRDTGEGPCLDAITHSVPCYGNDLSDDPRWPVFGPQAAATGLRSILAIPLATNGTLGALNLYARYPDAFGVLDRARGLLLATLAAEALSAARIHADEERHAADLHAALATREMIGQAQGILMERERITGDQAFDILRRASQHLNRKLREVAQTLVDTGEQPDTGSPRAT